MGSETVVIGLNWVGDNILALPTYKALQQRFRDEGGLAVAAPANVSTLLASAGIFADVVPWTRSMTQRIRVLREGRYKRAIILPNSFRAAAVSFAARIPERWGYRTDCRGLLLSHALEKPRRGHQLDDYSPLLEAVGASRVGDEIPTLTLPHALREKARKRLRAIGIRLDRPLFGIHAGGLYGRAKHWGDERFGEVASRLRQEGFDVMLLTSPGERQQAERISAHCSGLPMTGQDGDVLQLAAAIAHCTVIVTGDSGPLHLAAALAVPSVSIFGPTDPNRTVIPGASRVIRKAHDCQPCYQRECPLGHHRCMKEITPDDVHEAAVGVFQEIEPSRSAASAGKAYVVEPRQRDAT
ncbi:MAG TPA: lipopolysaccharide heptosyltransferase II [Thermoanaerobaculia bacterium]|jgi:heptosyltransferase-2